MTYDFRIRATMGSNVRIDADCYELVLHHSPLVRVTLHAGTQNVAIKDSEVFIVRGTGFASVEEAQRQGGQWLDWVMVGFAAQLIGADFVRAPLSGGMAQAGFDIMRRAIEPKGYGPVQLYNERSGVQVYPTEPPAHFFHGQARGMSLRLSQAVLDAIRAAQAADVHL